MRPEGEFAIAREMQRLREEVADLKWRLREAEAKASGKHNVAVIERTGHVGQAAKLLACLVANAGRVVSYESLMDAAGMNGELPESHLRVVVSRIRKRLREVYPLPAIIGAFGVGYKIDSVAAAWLMQETKSGGFDVSRSS